MHLKIITSVSKFLYIWGSAESLLEIIKPLPDPVNPGKINNACRYLRDRFKSANTPSFYVALKDSFINCIREIPHFRDIESEFRTEGQVGISGMGLHMVYKIRNKIAHGALEFPYSSEEGERIFELIECSSRMVLLSIQMLLSSYFVEKSFKVQSYDDDSSVEVHDLLRTLHIDSDIY